MSLKNKNNLTNDYNMRGINSPDFSQTIQDPNYWQAILLSNLSHPAHQADVDEKYSINGVGANNNSSRYELYLMFLVAFFICTGLDERLGQLHLQGYYGSYKKLSE